MTSSGTLASSYISLLSLLTLGDPLFAKRRWYWQVTMSLDLYIILLVCWRREFGPHELRPAFNYFKLYMKANIGLNNWSRTAQSVRQKQDDSLKANSKTKEFAKLDNEGLLFTVGIWVPSTLKSCTPSMWNFLPVIESNSSIDHPFDRCCSWNCSICQRARALKLHSWFVSSSSDRVVIASSR